MPATAIYHHDHDVGPVSGSTSAISAMAILESKPNKIFPFTVKDLTGGSSIIAGHRLDLIDTGPRMTDPVIVSSVTPMSFTFLTLAGHHRGAGMTITFSTKEVGGRVLLSQNGTYDVSTTWAKVKNEVFNLTALNAWKMQAANLRVALGTGTPSEMSAGFRKLPWA
jgi:hypothetical protein